MLEFKGVVHNNMIQLPDEIASQFHEGQEVVLMATTGQTNYIYDPVERKRVWQEALADLDRRLAEPAPGTEPYKWRREDAYKHLEKYYGEDSTD